MLKKTFHILVIAILALNLMGAWAFASALDCGMECCKPGDWAGTASFETPSCCQMSDVTCGFETGKYEELFDTAICCFTGSADKSQAFTALTSAIGSNPDTPTPRYAVTTFSVPLPQAIPVYLSNASFLC
jgi:hypothetical protein